MTQLVEISSLFSTICFILAIKCLSVPKFARIGIISAVAGMLIALITIFNLPFFAYKAPLIITIISGCIIGFYIANKVSLANIPGLIAGSHLLVSIALVLVSYGILLSPQNFGLGIKGALAFKILIKIIFVGVIGAITFGSSLVIFGRLQGIIRAKPLRFYARQYVCLALFAALIFSVYYFTKNQTILFFTLPLFIALIVGILVITPVSNVDITAAMSMLNSYSGSAIACTGFVLGNILLITTGGLIAASYVRLSYIICRSKNRSLLNVIFAAFIKLPNISVDQTDNERGVRISNAEDVAVMLKQAKSVIIVPGYGMALAGGQYAASSLARVLKNMGLKVRFAIHPQAGRMQGHMNFLLAGAGVDPEDMEPLDKINNDFDSTDVTLVIGANDITNIKAKTDKTSLIYGMPILCVGLSKKIIFIKRSTSFGYLATGNELFFQDNALMLLGDARKAVEDITEAMEPK